MKRVVGFLKLIFFLPIISFAQYWQQEVNYTIQVQLNDVNHELSGFESFEYINNSPSSLDFIYIHLWPNAYKNDETALAKQILESGQTNFYWSDDKSRGYIDSLNFKVNEEQVKMEFDKQYIDVAKLMLNTPLLPGQKITVTTPFHVKIPIGTFSRLGHIGQSYQITQWYPKPAVFDAEGWHAMPYLNQGEFYSEYGSFDVSITLPKNYVLGATGDMVDGEEELKWLNEKVEKTKLIEKFDEKDMAFPKSSEETKTLRFKQNNVHDFAWFADKRYHVLKGEVESPQSKRKVQTWAMFTNSSAKAWKNSVQYLNDAVYYYSLWNGEYPYNHCTAVDGSISAGGGMEYPNITVIGTTTDPFMLDVVITHEVGHNWFYGILGSNERDHAWMDEGINSFNEMRYIMTKYPDKSLSSIVGDRVERLADKLDISHYKQRYQYYLLYLFSARKNEDQAMETLSKDFTELNYGAIVYSKTAAEFNYLKSYLGEDIFDKCMHRYFDLWKFKHPQPNDIREVFENTSGKNLSWFFDDIVKTNKKIDYKFSSAKKTSDGYVVKVKNKGQIQSPFPLTAFDNNNKVVSTTWQEGFSGKKTISVSGGPYKKLMIDVEEVIPEINRKNNNYRFNHLFKKSDPVKLQFLGSLENEKKNQLFWLPVAGWNAYNKFQCGIALYNHLLPQEKFEYQLMPMYSFGTKNISGYANAGYHFYTDGIFKQIRVGTEIKRYGFDNFYRNYDYTLEYLKVAPEISFDIKNKVARSKNKHSIRIREVIIFEDEMELIKTADGTTGLGYKNSALRTNKNITDLTYSIKNSNTLNPYRFVLNVQQFKGDVRMSVEANYKVSYKKRRKSFEVRFFAGKIIGSENSLLAFNLSGNNDYLYDYTLLARNGYYPRNARPWIQNAQFAEKDGGFKNLSNIAPSSNYMVTTNIQASLPYVPVALYADVGITENTVSQNQSIIKSTELAHNMGIALVFVPKVFEVYFPIVQSANLNKLKYIDKVRLTLNFNLMNPFNFISNLNI